MSELKTPDIERPKRPASSPAENYIDIDKRLCDESRPTSGGVSAVGAGQGGAVAGAVVGAGTVVAGLPELAGLDQAMVKAIADAVALQIAPRIAEEVSKRVSAELNGQLSQLKGELTKVRAELEERDKRIRELELRADASEMYSRRNSVRVFGIPEVKDESTNNIIYRIGEAIGADLFDGDIDRSHRVGRQMDNKPRPIICKFTSYQAKLALLVKKKKLKKVDTRSKFNSDNVYINEDLTSIRAKIAKQMREVKKEGKILDTWTRDGVVFIKTPSEGIYPLKCEEDLRVLDL